MRKPVKWQYCVHGIRVVCAWVSASLCCCLELQMQWVSASMRYLQDGSTLVPWWMPINCLCVVKRALGKYVSTVWNGYTAVMYWQLSASSVHLYYLLTSLKVTWHDISIKSDVSGVWAVTRSEYFFWSQLKPCISSLIHLAAVRCYFLLVRLC